MFFKYLIVFAQAHHEFRIPELQSVAKIHGFDISLPEGEIETDRPFMIVGLQSENHARQLAAIYEFYAQGSTYEEVHVQNRANQALWSRYKLNTSFKFFVTAFNHKLPQTQQRQVVESFSYTDFMGKIDMKNPDIVLGCFEEYVEKKGMIRDRHDDHGQFRQVYLGRWIEELGSARVLIKTFDVKKRNYFGNTSMESEVSLLMANQTLASPGKLIYDPFLGTETMAYPAAYFGAQVLGSDIDGRQMQGKGSDRAPDLILYNYTGHLLTFDITHNPWRCGGLFDAIVTDPPYGVRASAKRLGRKKDSVPKGWRCISNIEAILAHDSPYIPPTKPYELSNLAV
ncbi:hypothetical protein K435DRAFT_819440 [Dendrothele bispora CBS 962.96]|uniref:Uncharacterized protein n=1 Tax=Dendrothele bispora (strain CBS 962.96) TaxID=1314807 RepID=A0A4V4HFV8_DENBC|nr:hypothetical protein K435DRAFT_819440 [Dendrothele bispora CBS 962.96]